MGHEQESVEFRQLLDILQTLRSPDGCPWDREQTPSSLRSSLLDETLEVIQGINSEDTPNVQEELGDVSLVVFLIAQIYEESEPGFIRTLLKRLNEKLIRRHPHVFSDSSVDSSDQVVAQWDRIKQSEKSEEDPGKSKSKGLTSRVPKGFPPLERAYEIQKKASKIGFDWKDPEPVMAKVLEELGEVKQELISGHTEHLEEELGDLLFSAVNLCRICKVHPSIALEKTNFKFLRRFEYIETKMAEQGLEPAEEHLDLMEDLWTESKGTPKS